MHTLHTITTIAATSVALFICGCAEGVDDPHGADVGTSTGAAPGATGGATTTSTDVTTGAASSSEGSSAGDDDATTGEDGEDCEAQRAAVGQIFAQSCSGCHAGGATKGGFGMVDDVDAMIAGGYIVRELPEQSPVYQRVASGEMPMDAAPLSAAAVAQIRSFIAACTAVDDALPGLSEPPACVGADPISTAAGLAAMKKDIGSIDLVAAPRIRYLDLSYLYNAGYCDDQIEGRRLALKKTLNSVSRGQDLIQLHPINPERTIFRIDLSHYKWTPELWDQTVAADPYAIVYQFADAAFIRQLTGADVFVQPGEWFIDAISRPPLYHTLLDIPATRQELEARFAIDVAANVAEEEVLDVGAVVRAGVFSSGVSENNRAFECHRFPEADNRYYCLSHDFASNQGPKSDIFNNPLDFVPDGGEIIFTLANRLQGYMIVNKAGARVDAAPLEIVADVEHGGEPVQNGLSCMGCHTAGMRLRGDEVWPAIADNTNFPADVRQRVENLYAAPGLDQGPDEMEALLGELQERFLGALDELGVPERIGGEEPTAAVHVAFDRDVTLSRAAAEFGISVDELLTHLDDLEGLELLNKKPVDRPTFQLHFAANACAMNLGVTSACLDATP